MGTVPFEEALFTSQRAYVDSQNDIYIDGVVLLNIDHLFIDIKNIKKSLPFITENDILFALNTMLSGVNSDIFKDILEDRLKMNIKITDDNISLLSSGVATIKENLESLVENLKSKYQFYISIDEDRVFILNKYFSFIETIYQVGEKEKVGYILNIILCSRR